MEVVSLPIYIKLIELLGPLGLIAVVWYMDTRNFQRMLEDNRKETAKILTAYREDVDSIKEMYRNNVKLVEGYESMCKDLHDLVVLNVDKLFTMNEKINQNEFCPLQRLRKTKIEVGG